MKLINLSEKYPGEDLFDNSNNTNLFILPDGNSSTCLRDLHCIRKSYKDKNIVIIEHLNEKKKQRTNFTFDVNEYYEKFVYWMCKSYNNMIKIKSVYKLNIEENEKEVYEDNDVFCDLSQEHWPNPLEYKCGFILLPDKSAVRLSCIRTIRFLLEKNEVQIEFVDFRSFYKSNCLYTKTNHPKDLIRWLTIANNNSKNYIELYR